METSIIDRGPGPTLLVSAGVHGDEYEPMMAVRQLAVTLQSNNFMGKVTLVPCVNLPAFRLGQRTGSDGLDLARVCPGNPAGSETEQLAFEISELIRQADFYIDLHTGGVTYEVFPLAGYVLHRDAQILGWQRRMAEAFNLDVIWGTSGELDGRTLSVARDEGIPAIYCEYFGGCECREEGVQRYHDGCLRVMAEIGMLEASSAESTVTYRIEDPRPQSGHMQICNPAPHDGVWRPAFEVGTLVRRGQSLGTVSHLFDAALTTSIPAPHDGLLLTGRVLPKVTEGESVGVVVEV